MDVRKSRFVMVILGIYLLIPACTMQTKSDVLSGKILVEDYKENEYVVRVNSYTPTSVFRLQSKPGVVLSGLKWLNKKDSFICNANIEGSSPMEARCSIVQIDMSGRVIGRIYDAENGEIAWSSYSSRNDKYLIFTTRRLSDPNLFPFEELSPMVSMVVMDLEQKKIVSKVDSVGRLPNLKIMESPWLHDNIHFVYSVNTGAQFRLQGSEKSFNAVEGLEGIYLFDVRSGKQELIISEGHSAVVSPTKDLIAYRKGNYIRTMDLKTRTDKAIYEHSADEHASEIHWSPDGNHLYFAYTYYWGIGDLSHRGEKLIDVTTGKEKPFKKFGLGWEIYSWK